MDAPPTLEAGVHNSIGVVFFGFTASVVLYGITVLQAYQYFMNSPNDSKKQKASAIGVCMLDTIHVAFSIRMMYSFLIQHSMDPEAAARIVWSLKGQGTTQVLFIVIVQFYYLQKIWKYITHNAMFSTRFVRVVQLGAIFMGSLAVAIATDFIFHLQGINAVLSFAVGFEYVIYMGFGATALIDSSIALAMCIILHMSRVGSGRTDDVVSRIIRYFLSNSLASILCLILYVTRPDTLLYLAMQYSISRLYANSFLAMCNDRHHRLDMLNAPTVGPHMGSDLCFADPENMNHHIELSATDHLSPKLWSRDLKVECEGLCGKG
ncbi:hypothetical protein BDQ12DRAFT_728293 [Crucibulum laeve]|uniref:DUF6534 domain-containing protein n=1 Tax=Crucibulum laeve TaxID=68775 RepID=A0A5C3LIG8_9AGAR|nr:hypothetical protein BDQ12DRAFT_728293 [Crucibulum laeve]